MTREQRECFDAGLARLTAGEPWQYVAGCADFFGHAFHVDRRVLIPRPETELLADAVLNCAPLWRRAVPHILDAGTGSGCLVVSLALARPAARYVALDRSADALAVARDNAFRHGVTDRIAFLAQSLESAALPPADAVVANPPYVRTDVWARLPRHIRAYEPRAALDGGPDGLAVIRTWLDAAARILKPGGWLFMEIGSDQGPAVAALAPAAGFTDSRIIRDYAGLDRMVCATRAPLGA